jgi:hypothetical protein
MRFVQASFLLFLGACGGNVVVDGAGGATTTTSSTGVGAGVTTTGVTTTGVTTTVVTTSTVVTTTAGSCPTLPPNPGDPCSTPGLGCPMPLLCCGVTVTCTASGTWNVPPADCGQPCIPCGPPGSPGCSGEAVCVFYSASSEGSCEPNPCPGQALGCTCAESVCNGLGCVTTMGPDVYCQ